MSIFGALYAGVAGLSVQSTAMGAISDNISNVNTIGYKGATVRFATMVTEQATATSYSSGGVGARPFHMIASQGLLAPSSSRTDIAIAGDGFFAVTDVAQWDDNVGKHFFTRAGSFKKDERGYLRNDAGYYLQGWRTDINGNAVSKTDGSTLLGDPPNQTILTELETIRLDDITGSARATSAIEFSANLPAENSQTSKTETTSLQLFDSLGSPHSVVVQWSPRANTVNTWDLAIQPPEGAARLTLTNAAAQIYASSGRLDFEAIPADGNTLTIGGTTYEFDTNAAVGGGNTAVNISGMTSTASVVDALIAAVGDARLSRSGSAMIVTQTTAGTALTINATTMPAGKVSQDTAAFTVPALTAPAGTAAVTFDGRGLLTAINVTTLNILDYDTGALNSTIALDLGTIGHPDGLTQFDAPYNPTFSQDGSEAGYLKSISIGEDGLVAAQFHNGTQRYIYRIPVAVFPNANGLSGETGNAYSPTTDSGNFSLRYPSIGGAGKLAASSLENSTVDLAGEFSNMIVTQRAYSASAKIITTTDQMLDELISIKR